MIVSAPVFLILLVLGLVHGAPTPPENIQLPPLRAVLDGFLPLSRVQEEPHTNTGLTNAGGVPHGRFEDFTESFKNDRFHPAPGRRIPVQLPPGAHYRTSGVYRNIQFKTAGPTYINTNAIAVTEKYLVCLRKGSIVNIAHDPNQIIHVPADKTVRVVKVPLEEMERIWGACLDYYKKKWEEIKARGKTPEGEKQCMFRCFHINLWHVGGDFIETKVGEYDI